MASIPNNVLAVYIEDMIPLNETILWTREKRFHLGVQRIILCLYATVGLFTVNRKGALLHLQYKHSGDPRMEGLRHLRLIPTRST
jgi:Protein of unknown function (DUF3435)